MKQKIINTLADVLGESPDAITPESVRQDLPSWDSLSNIRLIVALEQEFSVSIGVAEIADVESVEGLVSLIEQKVA